MRPKLQVSLRHELRPRSRHDIKARLVAVFLLLRHLLLPKSKKTKKLQLVRMSFHCAPPSLKIRAFRSMTFRKIKTLQGCGPAASPTIWGLPIPTFSTSILHCVLATPKPQEEQDMVFSSSPKRKTKGLWRGLNGCPTRGKRQFIPNLWTLLGMKTVGSFLCY